MLGAKRLQHIEAAVDAAQSHEAVRLDATRQEASNPSQEKQANGDDPDPSGPRGVRFGTRNSELAPNSLRAVFGAATLRQRASVLRVAPASAIDPKD